MEQLLSRQREYNTHPNASCCVIHVWDAWEKVGLKEKNGGASLSARKIWYALSTSLCFTRTGIYGDISSSLASVP